MSFNYIEYKQKSNLVPQEIINKEEYIRDLYYIENCWTGRADILVANAFIQESNQLIINAITLFEYGYFDCAFYSLRQSLEISTTMVYLSELNPEKKSKN